MDVKFVSVKRSLIDTIPIVNGQIVAVEDTPGLYYDMEEQRRCIGPQTWLPLTDSASTQIIQDANISIIQLVPNGGSDAKLQTNAPANTLVGKCGDKVTISAIPTPTRNGYQFVGWFKNQDDASTKSDKFPSAFPAGLTLYYASWLKL